MPQSGADRPHPGDATSRSPRAPTTRPAAAASAAALHRAVTRAAAALRDLRARQGASRRGGYGLTLLLHSLAANYNQFAGTRNQSQFGERGPGSIVITPQARGPDGWYYDHAGADVFEVWADVAAHYKLDPDWTSIAGYSMGGYGTFKLGEQFPDLFARAQPTVGPPGLGIWVPPPTRSRAASSRDTNGCSPRCATSRS